MNRVAVTVEASDPLVHAGLMAQLRFVPEVTVVQGRPGEQEPEVTVVCAEAIDESVVRTVRAHRCRSVAVAVVAGHVDARAAMDAIEAGAIGILRRCEATPEGLRRAVVAARDQQGTLPPDLLGPLLDQVRTVQERVLGPRGMHFAGLSDRESSVLRLVADGHDTREIAAELSYSERTIKNVIQDVIRRYGLRNRSHAVAYVLRQGLL